VKAIVTILLSMLFLGLISSCVTMVNIQSEPAGADVILNGKPIGQTPVNVLLSDEAWKTHTVILKKAGYQPIQQTLSKEVKVGPIIASIPFLVLPWPLIWVYGPEPFQYFLLHKED
jgi:hypothetical protein